MKGWRTVIICCKQHKNMEYYCVLLEMRVGHSVITHVACVAFVIKIILWVWIFQILDHQTKTEKANNFRTLLTNSDIYALIKFHMRRPTNENKKIQPKWKCSVLFLLKLFTNCFNVAAHIKQTGCRVYDTYSYFVSAFLFSQLKRT